MISYFRFRFQRQWRRFRRDFHVIDQNLRQYFNLHIWGKWRQLGIIRRLVVIWWGIMAVSVLGLVGQLRLFNRLASITRPVAGGTYTEAVVGRVKILNPVFAEGGADADINRLVFSGLVRFGPGRKLEPALAAKWTVSDDGKTYTFNLRRDAVWQDGHPFTAADVAFTVAMVQNPDVRSPLYNSWQGITVKTPDKYTVQFSLSGVYPPFLASTTLGIIPEHLLSGVPPASLRAAEFNQRPIGTGPFQVKSFLPDRGEVDLAANPRYFRGKPKLDKFVFLLFDDSQQALDAYAKHQADGVSRVAAKQYNEAQKLARMTLRDLTLPAQTDLFLRVGSPILSDAAVRRALVWGTDREELIDSVLDGRAIALRSPLLSGQTGFDPKYQQPRYNLKKAMAALDEAGWKEDKNGNRHKGSQPLRLRLVTLKGSDYERVAAAVQVQWALLGIDTQIIAADATALQQSYIRPRNYDVLLYGINIGHDPDVYAFWHSSQANDPGVNLSQYNSTTADKALEAGRINTDPEVRRGKYMVFLSAWIEDAPAVVLYQPFYTYGQTKNAGGFMADKIMEPADRFYNVENWTVKTETFLRG